MPYHPHVCTSNILSAAVILTKGTFFGDGYMSSSTFSPWFPTRAMSSDRFEELKTPASIYLPWADGGAVEFWISGGGGSVYLPKRPSSVPFYQTIANLLAKCKVYLGTVVEEKKKDFYERPQSVTWDWCVTRRLSNCCVGRAFGKCTLTTADGYIFLRSTENCATWHRYIRRHIRGGARILFWGGGVSNN